MAGFPNARRSGLGPWKLVRIPNAFPPAWVARQVREAPTWGILFLILSRDDAQDEAWFLAEDHTPAFAGPRRSGGQRRKLERSDGDRRA